MDKEKIISITADWKIYALASCLVFCIAIIIGWNMKDTGIQDNMENIQKQSANIKKQKMIQENAEIEKVKSQSSIEASQKILKEKYKITITE